MIKKVKTKYLKISSYVEALIRDGGLTAGDKLPSVRALAEKFNTTGVTVSRGLQLLAERHLIVSNVGSGSFVAETFSRSQENCKQILGLLVHSSSDAYAMYVVKAILEAAGKQGISIRTACAEGLSANAIDAAKKLKAEGCASLIVPWIPYRDMADAPNFVRNCPLPCIIPIPLPGLEDNWDGTPESRNGNMEATKAEAEYFRLLGEKRIALLGPNAPSDFAMKNMLMGYAASIMSSGLESLTALVEPSNASMDGLAARWAPFKGSLAVIAYDDVHAVRFIASMRKLGLEAPGDFKIIGCNDTKDAMFCDPPLSSVHPCYSAIAENFIKAAQEMIEGRIWRSQKMIPNKLMVRESCGGLHSSRLNEIMPSMGKKGFFIEISESATVKNEETP